VQPLNFHDLLRVLLQANKVYQTAPVNLTSNVILRVEGTMRAVENRSAFPKIAVLPSVGHDYDTNGPCTSDHVLRNWPVLYTVTDVSRAFSHVPNYLYFWVGLADGPWLGFLALASGRRHPFVFAVGGSNITVSGSGTIDGAGAYWWPQFHNRSIDPGVGRPHLMEMQNITGLVVTGVTLLNSAFWTFHPTYCKDVGIEREI
jgi:polygalacturonase